MFAYYPADFRIHRRGAEGAEENYFMFAVERTTNIKVIPLQTSAQLDMKYSVVSEASEMMTGLK